MTGSDDTVRDAVPFEWKDFRGRVQDRLWQNADASTTKDTIRPPNFKR